MDAESGNLMEITVSGGNIVEQTEINKVKKNAV